MTVRSVNVTKATKPQLVQYASEKGLSLASLVRGVIEEIADLPDVEPTPTPAELEQLKVTVDLDDWATAKEKARQRGTTVPELVRQQLEDLVSHA